MSRVRASILALLISVLAAAAPAQTFTSLASFTGANGSAPLYGVLAQGVDGNYYGVTWEGGTSNAGTVFNASPAGVLTTVYNFTGGADGAQPKGGLVLGSDGNFYGTTEKGGANLAGTVFKVTPAGTLTTLHAFTGKTDGKAPSSGLLLGANGNFYGTTSAGGANGDGTIFEINSTGKAKTLYGFAGAPAGSQFNGALVQAANGTLYGTTVFGGAYGAGSIYTLTSAGAFSTLYSFPNGVSGAFPYAPLAQGVNTDFYGTAEQGGATDDGIIFSLTPGGTLATLYNFVGGADQGRPLAGLLQASDGNLYGTTLGLNAPKDVGTIFKITPAGALTTLHTFAETDGAYPYGGLMQATNGNFYGTTSSGGSGPPPGYGTVFSLSEGLPPMVKAVPRSGKVGSSVIILGDNLTGASAVSFNGTAATFTVVSATEITVTVPTGATSGTLTVTTPGGALTGVFLVVPSP
jgi:uncharacterized repeat protein (TIGR03803 family)